MSMNCEGDLNKWPCDEHKDYACVNQSILLLLTKTNVGILLVIPKVSPFRNDLVTRINWISGNMVNSQRCQQRNADKKKTRTRTAWNVWTRNIGMILVKSAWSKRPIDMSDWISSERRAEAKSRVKNSVRLVLRTKRRRWIYTDSRHEKGPSGWI